jgi:hypothetical protein
MRARPDPSGRARRRLRGYARSVRKALFIVLPVVVVGVIGGIVAIIARESDANFVFRQQHAANVEPRQVERAVMRAREPVPGNNGTRAISGKCSPGRQGERHNPWLCRIRYASGREIYYQVVIDARGAFKGANATGERLVNGCCVAVPSSG